MDISMKVTKKGSNLDMDLKNY